MCGVFFASTFTLNPVGTAFGDLTIGFAGTGAGGTGAGSSIALLPGAPFLYPKPLLGGVADTPDPYIQITIFHEILINIVTIKNIKWYTLILFASRMISFSGSSRPIGSLKNVKLSIVNSFVLTGKNTLYYYDYYLYYITTNKKNYTYEILQLL